MLQSRFHIRMTAAVLALLLLICILPFSVSAAFTDVADTDWFAQSAARISETGLMIGNDEGAFLPQKSITGAEAVTLLARTHARLTDNGETLSMLTTNVTPWYGGYIAYCKMHSLFAAGTEDIPTAYLEQPLDRAQLLLLLSSLPDAVWEAINTVEDNAIPDVPMTSAHAAAVYRAYRPGITVGTDSAGTFLPEKSISRAEVAAMLIRVIDPAMRQKVTLTYSTDITLYAADGTTVTVPKTDAEPYLAVGWKETPYPDGFDAEDVLNAMPLSPTLTGYTPLDDMIGALFAKIHTADMTTYEKVIACYDYLVDTSTYGRSPVSGSYRKIYKSNPYADPAPGLECPMRTVLSGYSGYDYYYIAMKDHALEAYTIMYASEMLDAQTGWCDHFSSAFAVMMQRLGLPAFPLYVNSRLGNEYKPHMTSVMTVGGVDCFFDPQIEAVLVSNTGKNEHKRFCRPLAEMSEEYRVLDDLELCRALFGTFDYDRAKMAKILE
ncbi:MAG: S-layer homology domain-containing protein [Clostridia bacterium]|nr:S-layer homology domain-containing protein [Clostridia bacterium]